MYFLMQLRRAAKILPAVLCVNLVLCALAGAAIGTLSGRNTADDAKKRLRIGISGDAGDTYLGFGINAVSKLDSSRYYVEFAQLDEKDAASELDAGRLSAYVVIPDGFVDAVSHGEIMTVKYVTSPSESGIAAMLREEILDAVTVMLRESQLGVYGAADVLRDTEPERSLGEVYDKVFVEYADYILSRGKICAVETADSVGVSSEVYDMRSCAVFRLPCFNGGFAAFREGQNGYKRVSHVKMARCSAHSSFGGACICGAYRSSVRSDIRCGSCGIYRRAAKARHKPRHRSGGNFQLCGAPSLVHCLFCVLPVSYI